MGEGSLRSGREGELLPTHYSQPDLSVPLASYARLTCCCWWDSCFTPRKGVRGGWVSLPGRFLLLGWGLENAGPGPLSSFGWRVVRFPAAVFLQARDPKPVCRLPSSHLLDFFDFCLHYLSGLKLYLVGQSRESPVCGILSILESQSFQWATGPEWCVSHNSSALISY